MVNPVPGYKVTTAYRKTSTGLWKTCGWHTGQDYAAPEGTPIVAARGGSVVHVNYGSHLGNHQFVIRPGDGTEDFYAHTSVRPPNNSRVGGGKFVAKVGKEGNATGFHLHFERHRAYGWACNLMDDPMKSHNLALPGGGTTPPPSVGYPRPVSDKVYLSKLRYGVEDSDSVWYLQDALNAHKLIGGAMLPKTGNYAAMTDAEVIKCQKQHGFGGDAPGTSNVGPKQAEHLFAGRGISIVYDI